MVECTWCNSDATWYIEFDNWFKVSKDKDGNEIEEQNRLYRCNQHEFHHKYMGRNEIIIDNGPNHPHGVRFETFELKYKTYSLNWRYLKNET